MTTNIIQKIDKNSQYIEATRYSINQFLETIEKEMVVLQDHLNLLQYEVFSLKTESLDLKASLESYKKETNNDINKGAK